MDAGRAIQIVDQSQVPGTGLFNGPEFDWTAPEAPCYRVLDLLHRKADGDVLFFSRVSGGKFRDIGGVQARRVVELFDDPRFLREIDSDSFFTPLAYWDSSLGTRKPNGVSPLLVNGRRRGVYLASFPACFVDLDLYRENLKFGHAVGAVMVAADEGKIPHPSIYFNSGRGLWCFWLLVDPETGRAPRNTRSNMATWTRIERKLVEILRDVGSDPKAKLLSQVCRIPGSVNTRVGKRVSYHVAMGGDGNVVAYSLEEIATTLGVRFDSSYPAWRMANEGRVVEDHAHKLKDPRRQELGKRGARSLWLGRLEAQQRLIQLRADRGELVPVGKRRSVAQLCVIALVRSGMISLEECHGQYASVERKHYVRGRLDSLVKCFERGGPGERFDLTRDLFEKRDWHRGKWSDVKIAELYNPTDEESLASGIPTVARAEARREAWDKRVTRAQKRRKREEAILDAVSKHPTVLARTLVSILSDAHGIAMTERTARRYLANLRATGELSDRPSVKQPCLDQTLDN